MRFVAPGISSEDGFCQSSACIFSERHYIRPRRRRAPDGLVLANIRGVLSAHHARGNGTDGRIEAGVPPVRLDAGLGTGPENLPSGSGTTCFAAASRRSAVPHPDFFGSQYVAGACVCLGPHFSGRGRVQSAHRGPAGTRFSGLRDMLACVPDRLELCRRRDRKLETFGAFRIHVLLDMAGFGRLPTSCRRRYPDDQDCVCAADRPFGARESAVIALLLVPCVIY